MHSDTVFKRKNYIIFAIMIISVLLIEIFGFNFRHWMTLTNRSFEEDPFFTGEGISSTGDHTYSASTGSYNIAFHADDSIITSAYIDIRYTEPDKAFDHDIEVDLLATDEGHRDFYTLGSRNIYAGEEISKYTLVKLYGRAGDLIISPKLEDGDEIYLHLIMNPVIPMHVSPLRMFFLLTLLLIIWGLRPASTLHSISWLSLGKRTRCIISCAFGAATLAILISIVMMSTGYHTEPTPQEDQYQKLAEALAHGSVSLLEPVDERMLTLDNPYDPLLRYSVFKEESDHYRWDNAYRDSKYYVYFGVVPAVLFYLPYYLITGSHIHNFVVCLILLTLLIAGYMILINELINKYNKTCSVAMWLISSLALNMGSYVIYAAGRPDHYNIPILSALVFGVFGMWSFLRSIRDDMRDDEIKPNNRYLVIGSLLTALITGCRPQLFIFIIFDIIILKDYIFSKDIYKTKDGRSMIISMAVPMAVVAVFIMAYNYLRFGSVIDFGASYNLTLEDLINRGFVIRRGIVGITTILFSPIRYTGKYPFVDYYVFPTTFMGQITQTATPGGLFMVTPIALFSLLSLKYIRREIKNKKSLILLAFTMLISAVLVCMLDTIRAGVFQRYYVDIASFISLASIFVIWYLAEENKNAAPNVRAAFINIIITMLVFEAVFFALSFILVEDDGFILARPDIFNHLKQVWEFYL